MQTETTDFAKARVRAKGLSYKVRATIFFGEDYEFVTDKIRGLSKIELSKSWDYGKYSPGSITITIDNSDLSLSDNRWPTRVPSALKNVDKSQDYQTGVWYERYFNDLIKIEFGFLFQGTYRWITQGIYYIESKTEDYNKMTVTFTCGDIMKIILDSPIAKNHSATEFFTDSVDDNRLLQFYVKYGIFRQDLLDADPAVPLAINLEDQYISETAETVLKGRLLKPMLENGILSVENVFVRLYPNEDWIQISDAPFAASFTVIYDSVRTHLVKWIKLDVTIPTLPPVIGPSDLPYDLHFELIDLINKLNRSPFCCSCRTVNEPVRVLYDFIYNTLNLGSALIDASGDLSNPATAYDFTASPVKSFDKTGKTIENWLVKVDIEEETSAIDFINEICELMNSTLFSSLDYILKCVLDSDPLLSDFERNNVDIFKDFKNKELKLKRDRNWVKNWIEVHYEYASRVLAMVEADSSSITAYGQQNYIIKADSSRKVRMITREGARHLGEKKLSQLKEPEVRASFGPDLQQVLKEINDVIRIESGISGVDAYFELVSVNKNLIGGDLSMSIREARNVVPEEDDDVDWLQLDDANIGLDDSNYALW